MKISNKLRKHILNTVTQAFTEIITKYDCYNSPPEMWQGYQRERWDELSALADLIQNKLDKILCK